MNRIHIRSTLLALGLVLSSIAVSARAETSTLTVAGGCFWCVESDFESVTGVTEVVSGYTGGHTDHPTYKQVSRGGTGHYEAVQIHYDPAQVSEERLLHLFFRSIDPTDAGGQFCDRGESYRTAVFVHSPEERALAEAARANAQAALGKPVVTPVLEAKAFTRAEDYHQNYYKKDDTVFTRRGLKSKAEAYAFYRKACGRDARVAELWGPDAPFVHHGKD